MSPATNDQPWWRSPVCWDYEGIPDSETESSTRPSHRNNLFASSKKVTKYKIPQKNRRETLRLMEHLEQRSGDFWEYSEVQSQAGYFKTHDRERKQGLLELGHACFLKQKAYQHHLAVQKAAKMNIEGGGVMGRMLLRVARKWASIAMGKCVNALEMYGLYLRGIGYVRSR